MDQAKSYSSINDDHQEIHEEEEVKGHEEQVNTELIKEKSWMTNLTPNNQDHSASHCTHPSDLTGTQVTTLKQDIKYFLRNFNEVLFCFILLSASLTVLSILNLPYTLFGLILAYRLFDYRPAVNKFKRIINWLFLFFVFINILFKTVIAVIYYTESAKDFINSNATLLISLGIKFIKEDTIIKGLNTFFGDLLIFAVLLILIKVRSKDSEKSIFENIPKTKYNFFSNFLMHSIIACLLAKAAINLSLSSVALSVIIYVGLIFWGFNKDLKNSKIFYIVLAILLVANILLTHIVNIYFIRKDYQDFPYIRYIGILKLKNNATYYSDYVLTVLAALLCIISIKLSSYQKLITSNQQKKASKRKVKLWMKIRDFVISYILSPYFILHFCRIVVIYLIYTYRNYPTIALLFWFFCSCLIIDARKMKAVTYLLAWPVLVYLSISFMICSIPKYLDLDSKESLLAFDLLEKPQFEIGMVHLAVFLFAIFSKTLNIKSKVQIQEHRSSELSEILLDKRNEEEEADKDKEDTDKIDIAVEDDKKVKLKKLNDDKSISIFDLIFKLLITNVDKITLVFMYLIAIQIVNISHAGNLFLKFSLDWYFFNSINFP
jgi:hypothetical protein